MKIIKRKDSPILIVFIGNWHRNICKHLKVWKEADYYTEHGGRACKECCEANNLSLRKK